MQYVNDDMDDVFRKAGDQYPLRVAPPDWDKMQQVLDSAAASNQHAPPQKGKPFWLLLLVPFLLICTTYIPLNKLMPEQTQERNKSIAQATKKIQVENPSLPNNFSQNVPQHSTKNQLQQTTVADVFTYGKKNKVVDAVDQNDRLIVPQQKASTIVQGQQPAPPDYGQTTNQLAHEKRGTPAAVNLLPATAPPDLLNGRLQGNLLTTTHATLHKQKALFRNKGLYAGIVGSIDLTAVQLQKASRPGRHLGVIAGYKLNNRWSLESGVFMEKKYYYTKGSYYKNSRSYTPPNTSIIEVDGDCTMLEIPLLIKYDFNPKRKTTMFATAGVSSYIMKNEAYDFLYYYQTTGTYANHSKSYRNASTNLFSVVHLSGGISRALGSTTSLRVEPYLKLPVTGLGYGQLHFSSTGLNIGVVKKF
jgi:hypothetical protein